MSDVRSCVAAARCLLRGVPLFFAAEPRTPLRVLAIIALDTVHVLRTSRPLPRSRLGELATVLDFQACTNAAWDGKPLSLQEYRAALRRLDDAGLVMQVESYLDRLRALESRRPSIGGERRSFDDARAYREEVARLSLATVAAIALDIEDIEEAIRQTDADSDLNALFRMAVQCQIVDDVLDYAADLSAGLPSYLTATESLPEAMELTACSARAYGAGSRCGLALRVALRMLSGVTRFVVRRGPPTTVAVLHEQRTGV